jgi:hypothetical protein
MGKVIKIMVLSVLVSVLFSCHRPVVTIVREVPVLRASSIYYEDSVYVFMGKYKDTNKEIAASYFNKGLELENSNLPKAIYFIKRSITLQPTLKKYRELAPLLAKSGAGVELRQLYRVVLEELNDYGALKFTRKYLFGPPDDGLLVEYVTSNILNFHYAWEDPEEQDVYANDSGINLKEVEKKVLTDPRLKFDTNSIEYKDILLSFLSDSEAVLFMKNESVFNAFLNTIKDTSSVFEISQDSVAEFDYSRNQQRDAPGPEEINMDNLCDVYLKESNGKDTDIDYNYKRRIKINDSINAVVYAIDTSETACPRDMRHIYYRLVTYGKKANIKADLIVANQSGEELSTLKYNHGALTVKHYKRYWENPYNKKDFNNHLQKVELTAELGYGIQPDGTIKSLNGKE